MQQNTSHWTEAELEQHLSQINTLLDADEPSEQDRVFLKGRRFAFERMLRVHKFVRNPDNVERAAARGYKTMSSRIETTDNELLAERSRGQRSAYGDVIDHNVPPAPEPTTTA